MTIPRPQSLFRGYVVDIIDRSRAEIPEFIAPSKPTCAVIRLESSFSWSEMFARGWLVNQGRLDAYYKHVDEDFLGIALYNRDCPVWGVDVAYSRERHRQPVVLSLGDALAVTLSPMDAACLAELCMAEARRSDDFYAAVGLPLTWQPYRS
jgi:hypothetical protein